MTSVLFPYTVAPPFDEKAACNLQYNIRKNGKKPDKTKKALSSYEIKPPVPRYV
jgi:hypothetical protein